MVSVVLAMEPDAPENDAERMPELVLTEFERPLPLYRFASWHPTTNNYVHGL